MTKKTEQKYKLGELVAQCDKSAPPPADMAAWEAAAPVGNEIVEASSGNVFADLGLPDADALKRKAVLMAEIAGAIERHGLTKESAAQQMEMTPEGLSRLLRGDFERTETELQGFIDRLADQ